MKVLETIIKVLFLLAIVFALIEKNYSACCAIILSLIAYQLADIKGKIK